MFQSQRISLHIFIFERGKKIKNSPTPRIYQMPYGFSKAIRNRYRQLWARKQIGKGIVKNTENLQSQRKRNIEKSKRKSKKSQKRQKKG